MKVGIDAQSTVGRKTGIGYYAGNLIDHFKRVGDMDFFYFKNTDIQDLNTVGRIRWENFILPGFALKEEVDILHTPGFAGPKTRGSFKKVTTVCDLIGMIYPRNLNVVSRFYWQRWLPGCVRNSDIIIAISEHTKRDLVRLLDIPERKIRVILLAADPRFSPIEDAVKRTEVRRKYDLPEEFILNVGTVEPRKNVCGLVEAFSCYLEESHSGPDLVIAGKKDWGYAEARRKVDELGISSRVHFTDYIDDEDLPVLYNLAKFFVYPSFYEGFGLPVLEALSCGRPVICSNASSLPEVTQDAALLIDPDNIRDLKEAIATLDKNEAIRTELSGRAVRQAGKFSWEKTVSQTLDVYKETLKIRD